MKPLNLDNRPCSPIASNCVIWTGDNIPCINLCSGDTITDVVFKLATELCTIMDQLKVSNYDLACLTPNCPPADFTALIQLLINKICELNGIPAETTKAAGCPDCVVSVAPCFVVGTQTTMQLVDYVQMIATRVCSILDQIAVINNQITNLDNRVTVLENAIPPSFTLPSITVECTLSDGNIIGGNSYPIDQILDALINDGTYGYCALLGATGLPAALLSAVAGACVTADSPTVVDPLDTMSGLYPDWVTDPVTVADTITNLWITICDIRDGLASSSTTVVDAGNGIDVQSNTVGTTTTYTVSLLGAMRAQSPPIDNANVAPAASVDLYDGETMIMTQVYDDDNAYDPATGIWTCPVTGIYNLSFYIHMSNELPSTAGFTSGMVVAGIVATTPRGYYAVNTCSVGASVLRHIDITGQALGMNLTAGIRLQLNVLNLTNVDYISYFGDVARFVVQRVR